MTDRDEVLCQNLEELLTRYGDMVYRMALHNMRNVSDAQDITQDIFLKIAKRTFPVAKDIQHEKAWMMRVCINQCKDRWKYDRLHQTIELQEELAAGKQKPVDFGLLYEVMKLPVKYRNVIYLFYYEEMSVQMIAKIMQKKEATILTWLHRARKRLRVELEGGEEDA